MLAAFFTEIPLKLAIGERKKREAASLSKTLVSPSMDNTSSCVD